MRIYIDVVAAMVLSEDFHCWYWRLDLLLVSVQRHRRARRNRKYSRPIDQLSNIIHSIAAYV